METNTSPESVISHWAALVENLQESPLQFYHWVEAALLRRQIPNTENSRVEYAGGVLAPKREYLRVKRGSLVFDICGAPFGTAFFVSWWQTEAEPPPNPFMKLFGIFGLLVAVWVSLQTFGFFTGLIVLIVAVPLLLLIVNNLTRGGDMSDAWLKAIPGVGWLYKWLFKQPTYYQTDTALMFQKAVHNAVQEVIDEMTKTKGLRALSEAERKPVMLQFYGRRSVG